MSRHHCRGIMGFEYKIISVARSDASKEFNILGADGWELVNFIEISSNALTAAFKRSLASERPFMAGV